MNNRNLLIFFFLVFALKAFSQTENFSSLNMFNYMFYNPGYAGDGNEIEARFLSRSQWMGFNDGKAGASVQTFNIDAPFRLFGMRHGAGLSFNFDKIGYFDNTDINFSYAYRKPLAQGELGIGAGLIMTNQKFKGVKWLTPSGDTGDSDPGIPRNEDNLWRFDASLGVFYRSDNLYMSFSVKNLLQSNLKYTEKSSGTAVSPSYYARQGFFGIGYEYQLPNPMFSFKPGLFLATDLSSTEYSISGILTYNNRIFGGVAYKPVDAVTFLAGMTLPSGLEIAVSYDLTTSRIIKNSSGSFEFMLGYSFSLDMDKDIRKYKSVRFL